jgi:transcriptional regulator with XRE-family HTH domain
MHIGKNIQTIRELLGIKQATLAQRLKINRLTISKIEQTENIREQIVEKIAKALGVTITMILHFNDQNVVDLIANGSLDDEKFVEDIHRYFELVEKIIE